MNPEIKKRWTDALRSGNYQQTTGVLHRFKDDNVGYCCLGVLCDLAAQEGVVNERQDGYEYSIFEDNIRPTYDGSATELPLSVQEWAGFEKYESNPTFKNQWVNSTGHGFNTLAEVNDNGGTFEDIAKIIEEQF